MVAYIRNWEVSIMKTEREKLMRLQEIAEKERGRILADQSTLEAREKLPEQLIRELADVDLAAHAIAAELTRHTPRPGRGSET
jgi:hypothetical protein